MILNTGSLTHDMFMGELKDVSLRHYINNLLIHNNYIKWIYLLSAFVIVWIGVKPFFKLLILSNLILLTSLFYYEITFVLLWEIDSNLKRLIKYYFIEAMWLQLPILSIMLLVLTLSILMEFWKKRSLKVTCRNGKSPKLI